MKLAHVCILPWSDTESSVVDPQRPDTAFFSFLPAKDAQDPLDPRVEEGLRAQGLRP